MDIVGVAAGTGDWCRVAAFDGQYSWRFGFVWVEGACPPH